VHYMPSPTEVAVLREAVNALSPTARAELLEILMLPYRDRAVRIAECCREPRTRTLGQLLLDLGGDRFARASFIGMLRATFQAENGP
jgi:hypothetical protein